SLRRGGAVGPGADALGGGAAHRARQLLDARSAHAAQGAEAREELAALDRTDAGDVVQLRAQRALRARLAMEADREAVRLVAHALDELEDRRRAWQGHRLVVPRNEDQLFALGQAGHGLVAQPEL